MSIKQIKWLLLLGLPSAAFVTALLCGQHVAGAMKVVALTAGIIAISMIEIFGIIGIAFAGVVFIYSRNVERDLCKPDSLLILLIGSAATMLTAGLLATLLK